MGLRIATGAWFRMAAVAGWHEKTRLLTWVVKNEHVKDSERDWLPCRPEPDQRLYISS
jgi:hypothetical protein